MKGGPCYMCLCQNDMDCDENQMKAIFFAKADEPYGGGRPDGIIIFKLFAHPKNYKQGKKL